MKGSLKQVFLLQILISLQMIHLCMIQFMIKTKLSYLRTRNGKGHQRFLISHKCILMESQLVMLNKEILEIVILLQRYELLLKIHNV